MSIQILDIVLYSKNDERRVLSFRPGMMNIITGDSGTGKSALISIVQYCLGSSSCAVPEGVIRDNVVWYAVRFAAASAQHLVARRAPDPGRAASSDAHYAVGKTVAIPEPSAISTTTNIGSAMQRLAGAVGIGLNLHEPPEGQTREPLAANLRHALAFVFQPQNEISQPAFLFHKQSDHFVAQAIKDTLPYFLGAVDDQYVAKRAQLKELRRQLKERERSLAGLEAIAGDGLGGAAALYAEARSVGILPSDSSPKTLEEAIEMLRAATAASPDEQLARSEETVDQSELSRLNGERTTYRERLRRDQDELDAMRSLLADEGGYSKEAREQVARLSSLGIFSSTDDACCPLCEQPTAERVPSAFELQAEMQRATEQLGNVERHTPGLEALIVEREAKLAETRRLLRENRVASEGLRRSDDRLAAIRDASSRRAHVLGRISLFLETLPRVADSSELRRAIDEIQRAIAGLESDLSDDKLQERLESILSVLGRQLTTWAERLELEHSGNPFRLDLRRLQVVVDSDSGSPIPMERMGSGANWLGCHLIAHLALHTWFVRKKRPVPRFLFLDQPSQVYFPAEHDGVVDSLVDTDRKAVIRIFELIRDVVAELAPGLQVIVTEHADMSEDWYQDAIVERWKNGAALVPQEWL